MELIASSYKSLSLVAAGIASRMAALSQSVPTSTSAMWLRRSSRFRTWLKDPVKAALRSWASVVMIFICWLIFVDVWLMFFFFRFWSFLFRFWGGSWRWGRLTEGRPDFICIFPHGRHHAGDVVLDRSDDWELFFLKLILVFLISFSSNDFSLFRTWVVV